MFTLLIILHIVACAVLILVSLITTPPDEDFLDRFFAGDRTREGNTG